MAFYLLSRMLQLQSQTNTLEFWCLSASSLRLWSEWKALCVELPPARCVVCVHLAFSVIFMPNELYMRKLVMTNLLVFLAWKLHIYK